MPGVIQRCELLHMLTKKSNGAIPLECVIVALLFDYFAATSDLSALLQNKAEPSKHFSVAILTSWDARNYA